MSAETGRRQHQHSRPAQVVCPQPVSDKSIIDSVAGIINDIVPQAIGSVTSGSDQREAILWAKFEWADVNDPSFFPESWQEGASAPALVLALGYATGVQLWLVPASGEASELLSWRSGPVRSLRLLPSPRRPEEDRLRARRPLLALCDSSSPGQPHCQVSFVSLRSGETVKSIRFNSPVSEVLANRRSILVTFFERIAVFDARNLEDVLTITGCYPSPFISANPVALGSRWIAYCERRLLPAKRSSGGMEAEGVSSYTATVLYAAKSLGKGLRGLGETVASSLTGHSLAGLESGRRGSPEVIEPLHQQHQLGGQQRDQQAQGAETASSNGNGGSDAPPQPGVVSVLDPEAPEGRNLVAHFAAHSEAVVAMCFDRTGALLMTADRRGHDFHVFRLQSHPGGSSLAAVHHLYVLHRGDTSARVQDMAFSGDARWAVVSTGRGTSHVFPVAPYGGPIGMRTHSSPHVVNRLSRFHKSAGLGDDASGRSSSPQPYQQHAHEGQPHNSVLGQGPTTGATGATNGSPAIYPFSNPRLPPYPHPTVVHPLAQIRQPSSGHSAYTSSSRQSQHNHHNHYNHQNHHQQHAQSRHSVLSGSSDELRLCACFAPPRAWMYAQREALAAGKLAARRPLDSLFVMGGHGNLVQYDLEPRPAAHVPKEKICDDTPIEIDVEAKGQWTLARSPTAPELGPPLPADSPLLEVPPTASNDQEESNSSENRWLSQVEIFTHAGPHRRLWMGPQFVFKTYNAPSGVPANLVEAETVEIDAVSGSRPARSNPVNMPHAAGRPLMPVVIDGSGSSYEQSPRFVEAYGDALDRYDHPASGSGENQLREDLAEAMLETSSTPLRSTGRRLVVERVGGPVAKVVNPLGNVITVSTSSASSTNSEEAPQRHPDDDEDEKQQQQSQPQKQRRRTRQKQQQQHPEAKQPGMEKSTGSQSESSVCAEEGKCPEVKQVELPAKVVSTNAQLCAEMCAARELTVISSLSSESIEEVQDRRSICAEAGDCGDDATAAALEGAMCEIRAQSPAPLVCAERGGACGWSGSDEEFNIIPSPPPSPPPPALPTPPTPTGTRSSEEEIEQLGLDSFENLEVLSPTKPVQAKPTPRRQHQKLPPPPQLLLEDDKENQETKPPTSPALLLLLPMDTEEASRQDCESAPIEKSAPEDTMLPLPMPFPPNLGAAIPKKTNRSKKKKRR